MISFFQRLCGQRTGPIPLVSWPVLESSASRSWNICSGKICNFDGQNHVLGGDSTIFRADSSKFPGWDTPASNGSIISSFKLSFCNPPQFGNEATHPYGKVWWNSETWYIMCNIQHNIILYIYIIHNYIYTYITFKILIVHIRPTCFKHIRWSGIIWCIITVCIYIYIHIYIYMI